MSSEVIPGPIAPAPAVAWPVAWPAVVPVDPEPRPSQRQPARPWSRCRTSARSPRAQARRLLALRGVRGEAQFRALATFWSLAASSRAEAAADGRGMPVVVHADALGERLGLPAHAVATAVADLTRAGLLEPDTPGSSCMRLRPLEGLDEAVAHLSHLMRIAG